MAVTGPTFLTWLIQVKRNTAEQHDAVAEGASTTLRMQGVHRQLQRPSDLCANRELTAPGSRVLPVSVVDVAQQVRELQLALCIPYGLEVPQLLEGLHIPVSDLHASR